MKVGRKRAIALGYDPENDDAPRILANGQGILAEHIMSLAAEHAIPIRDDPLLVEALSGVDLGEMIPPELYRVIAEVFAYIYRIQAKTKA